jgi:hypothetical protein
VSGRRFNKEMHATVCSPAKKKRTTKYTTRIQIYYTEVVTQYGEENKPIFQAKQMQIPKVRGKIKGNK